MAALDAGELTPSEIINDDGLYQVGTQEFRNAGDAINGPIDLRDALKVSSDVYFYTLGGRLQENIDEDGDEYIQDWAKSLGFGDVTGLDVPGRGARAACRRPSGGTTSSRTATRTVPGRSATTSTSRSARATCWPRRSSSPSPTRRSETAAPW